MTLQECTKTLLPMALALRAEMDAPTFRAYFRALEDVPLPLLERAVEKAMQTARFMPKPRELRTFAEEARQEIRASIAMPKEPCDGCTPQGFTEELIDGVPRMVRCSCWKLVQAKVAALDVPAQAIALPPARDFSRIGEE